MELLYVIESLENSLENNILGVDVGGSHITAGLINTKTRKLISGSLVRKPVNSHGSYEEIMTVWGDTLLEACKGHAKPETIGIAMPGPFDYERGISLIKGFNKYDSLYQLNIKEGLANILKIAPHHIKIKNDAACFLQGEIFTGTTRGVSRVLGLTLGTGFGSAFGMNGIATDAELSSKYFKDRRAEDYFSTKWFLDEYFRLSGQRSTSVKEMNHLIDSDPLVESIFKRFCENLSIFLKDVLGKNDTELILIGGNIIKCDLIIPELKKQLKIRSFDIPIYISQLGEEAALVGAASLWADKFVR